MRSWCSKARCCRSRRCWMLPAPALRPRTPTGRVGVLHPAAENAAACRQFLADGEGLDGCWRFGILQTLDDYTSILRRGGLGLAAGCLVTSRPARVPPSVDAAFAALADYLAERDGWQAPGWAHDAARRTVAWYPAVPAIFHADADQESPEAFRRRGILITALFPCPEHDERRAARRGRGTHPVPRAVRPSRSGRGVGAVVRGGWGGDGASL